nr:ribonuclease H-like domain-containing protein [Tanacetum cinerariifolium]
CFNFAKGTRRFGESCRYVHDSNAHLGTDNNESSRGRGNSDNNTNELLQKLLQQLASISCTVPTPHSSNNTPVAFNMGQPTSFGPTTGPMLAAPPGFSHPAHHSTTRPLTSCPSLDVKNAFLHEDQSEIVYMHQPLGFRDSAHPDYVCLLQRFLYGLKQASRAWFQRIILLRLVFLIVAKKYAIEILEKAHMVSCNPSRTHVDTESKLGDDVQQVCLHMHDLREPHLSALKRILWGVQGTLNYGLPLFSSSTTDLVAYSDADWAGCPTTRRSTLGFCVFLGNNLLSWSAKRQPTLSRSSAEAEYRGVANVVAEPCWLRNLLRELHTSLSSATLLYCDNVRVLHVPCRYQFADIFTKGLPSALFEEFRSSLRA